MVGLGLALLVPVVVAAQVYEKNIPTAHPAIRYGETPLNDPVSRLARQLDDGTKTLEFSGTGFSYLPAVLEALDINPDSQVLVFSKTSLQRSRISPDVPRAIYFSDDVAVGFVPGGETIEMASYDPRQGAVFYTLSATESARPRVERPQICLACHHDVATLGIPGMYVGSVQTSESGRPSFGGSVVSDHRTPFADRWGGWFVDGTIREPHRGNAATSGPQGGGLASLLRKLDPARYLQPASDVIALMVLEHQTQMTNYFIRMNWESRTEEGPSEARLDEVARYMLFADEAPFDGPIEGVSTFIETFPQGGLRDRRGRSLRDLDLEEHLFRYPLSFMVHSDAFDALPDAIRAGLYLRMYDALTGTTETPSDPHRSLETRRAVVEILRETKRDLPDYWNGDGKEAPER